MTTELEQEFFKVFGIEPKYIEGENLIEYSYGKLEYPEITDRVLLEIICIHSYFCGLGLNLSNLYVKNPAELEAVIMQQIINWYQDKKYGHEKCKHQIQKLFKEKE